MNTRHSAAVGAFVIWSAIRIGDITAQMYANSGAECGQTPFEQKAIYWLAADMVRKAGEADSNLKKNGSDQTAESYLKMAPTAAEIKSEKMAGKQVAFKCWINESVTVPKS